MKAILQPIHPEHCAKILCGAKTIELRTKIPKIETPYKVYIYCTKHGLFMVQSRTNAACFKNMIDKYGGKVIGEYICNKIENYKNFFLVNDATLRHIKLNACIDYTEIINYLGMGLNGYGMCISDLVIYDKPKELSEFCKPCKYHKKSMPCAYSCRMCKITRPPQSWMYVEEVKSNEMDKERERNDIQYG